MFQVIFYQPILNILVFLYNIVPGHDLGIAIILMTIVIKLILLPLSKKAIKSQKSLQDLQPKVEAVKKQYKDQSDKMAQAMMSLYKENKVNPFSSCLPLLIQIPFLYAVFMVFRNGFANGNLDLVYPFITRPEHIETISLGFINLADKNIYIAVLAGLAQFWVSRMMMTKKAPIHNSASKDEDMMAIMNKQMMYMMPIMTIIFGATFPGGLALYWLVSTLFQGVQQVYIFKKKEEPVVEVITQ